MWDTSKMRRLLALFALLTLAALPAEAAARFWVPLTVTGAADNGSGACRITVGAGLATGKVTGETVTVASVTGATGCNVTTTITAISSTTFDLVGTTFGGLYVSGGTVAGGTWNATNIGNWGTASGVGSGAAVPTSADTVTFDAASGGGIVTVNFGGLITIQSLTCGAFTGTLDFAANDNSVTLNTATGFAGSGSGTRTINLGDGTWTLSASGANWTQTTVTGLTFNANGSTIAFTSTTLNTKTFAGGGQTYNIVTVSAVSGASMGRLTVLGANTYASLIVGAGMAVQIPASVTQTIAALTFTGTPTKPVAIASSSLGTAGTISVASGSVTMDYAMFLRDVAFTGGATFVATNSYDWGVVSGITITQPSFGGGGIIGGG